MKRQNWIDALRGFTMLSVVTVHVLVTSFGVKDTQSVLCILRATFTLPLFFIVSGWFLYRPLEQWTSAKVASALNVRGVALLGGTMVFASLYGLFFNPENALGWVKDADFDKYWYTFSLFQMFVYCLLCVCIGKMSGQRGFWAAVIALTVASWIFLALPPGQKYFTSWVLTKKTLVYWQFFACGMFLRRFSERFLSWLERPGVLSWAIVLFTAAMCVGHTQQEWWASHCAWAPEFCRQYASRYLGLLIVLNIFYHSRHSFDRDTRFMRWWLLIGRRTLDIYFLHYFLLPNMRWVGRYVTKGNTILPELAAGVAVALVVTAVCLALSALLRRAPLLNRLLGERPASTSNKHAINAQ